MNLRRKGNRYEAIAARYLGKQGYRILARQYRCPYGEIDLVARDGDILVFIEVKGRASKGFGLPREAIGPRKQRRIWWSAQHFLWSREQREALCRFDVVTIETIAPGTNRIEHIQGAFDGWDLG
jgi:putative endonuclease